MKYELKNGDVYEISVENERVTRIENITTGEIFDCFGCLAIHLFERLDAQRTGLIADLSKLFTTMEGFDEHDTNDSNAHRSN